MNRTLNLITSILVLLTLLALIGCGGEKRVVSQYGAITINAGPESDLIVAQGEYQIRKAFPVSPFVFGPSSYVVMDSVEAQSVMSFGNFVGTTATLDSLQPGVYSLLVYVSRLSVNQVEPDTIVSDSGDTTILDPTADMPPYDFFFRPIMIDSVRVAADSVAEIDLGDQLEDWRRPKQIVNGRWEAERVRYHKWRGAMARK
jgi:hypothetical protein